MSVLRRAISELDVRVRKLERELAAMRQEKAEATVARAVSENQPKPTTTRVLRERTKPVCSTCSGEGCVSITGGSPLERIPCHCDPKWNATQANAGAVDVEQAARALFNRIGMLNRSGIYSWPALPDRIEAIFVEALTAAEQRGAEKERSKFEALLREFRDDYDCDTGANGTHAHRCRVCVAGEALMGGW